MIDQPCRVIVSWSTGKDSAWMLYELRRQPGITVGALASTVNEAAQRVAMHGVRIELARAQAQAAGLPLWEIPLPAPCSNEDYEHRMAALVERALAEGFTHMAFGDLFLDDVRKYREQRLAGTGLTPLFPLWGHPTRALAHTMLAGGLRARVTCVDPRQAPRAIAGAEFDESMLAALPTGADPCGENGEFHTFAWAGPMFRTPVAVAAGEVLERDGFVFADLMPEGEDGMIGIRD
jgi:uncharacterized protein (TIGR00290 family)